jgi:hypothetical protein
LDTLAPNPTYFILGKFVLNSYVYKVFTGLGLNHYSINVLWTYTLFGLTTNTITRTMIDGVGTVVNTLADPISCAGNSATITGCFTGSLCFSNRNILVNHNTDSLLVNFSAVGSTFSTNPATNSWGIQSLFIVLNLCDPTCATCSGATATTCLSCVPGLFLQGSVCIGICPFYTMPVERLCVVACPAYYFLNTLNNYCESCPPGCPGCISST